MADHLPLRAQLDGPLPPASFGQVGRPSWRTRWRVYRKSAELDNALAAGGNPLSGPDLLWRADQLTDPARRLTLAETIEFLLFDSERRPAGGAFGPEGRLRKDLVSSNRSLLTVLAERLRSDGPHGLRGLAMCQRLLSFGAGHLYRSPSPLHLRWRLLEALAALEPRSPWPER